jgi:outer membrane protein TolC
LDADAAAKSFASRSLDAPGLKDYMVAHGHAASDWPVKQWGLTELTLAAFYYHPDLAIARAEAKAALAEAKLAGQRSPIKITPIVLHHSKQLDGADSPWSLGFDVEIPIASGTRRAAIVERAGYFAESAELNVGSVAWAVRSRVRSRLLDLYAARSTAQNLAAEVQTRKALVALLERRLEAGLVSSTELGGARVRLFEAQGQLDAAATSGQQASGQLAAAVGVPLDALRGQTLSFSEFDILPDAPQGSQVQREALMNRVDMRRTLLDYAAADASVKLEVAKQYPSFTLRPGYLWDQGDSIWFVAADLLLPAVVGNIPGIRAAEARREAAAQQTIGYQANIITSVQSALATYEQAAAGAKAAAQASRMQLARDARMQKQFDAGLTDRVEVTQARLESVTVERNAQAARIETQRVLGQLEDALQRPLSGGPLPAFVTGSELAEQPPQATASR